MHVMTTIHGISRIAIVFKGVASIKTVPTPNMTA